MRQGNVRTTWMRRVSAAAVAVLALALAALAGGCGGDDGTEVEVTGDLPTEGSLLFVVRGDAVTEGGRISIDSGTVEWFSDRPKRRAGVSDVDQLIDRWAGFGLAKDPPNAFVVGGETEAAVELSDPQLAEGSISFAYEPLQGQILEEGELGGVSVFIDDTGDGGIGSDATPSSSSDSSSSDSSSSPGGSGGAGGSSSTDSSSSTGGSGGAADPGATGGSGGTGDSGDASAGDDAGAGNEGAP